MLEVPYLTSDIDPVSAAFREEVDDFIVDEVPAYRPSGEGDHVFCHLEKRDLTTRNALRQICDAIGADLDSAGWAGLKDRRAVTRQWVSLHGAEPERLAGLELDGIKILEVSRHGHKLRTGHLRGNRFRVRLRQIDAAGIARARQVLTQIEREGLPNYYGEQRFGRQGANADRAAQWVRGQARPPRQAFNRKLEMSAFQSALFNRYVADRVARQETGRVFAGEVVKRHDTGGVFVVGDLPEEAEEVQTRADQFEVSATGPIFGTKMRWPEGSAREREEALLRSAELGPDDLRKWKRLAPGTRRFVRVPVPEIGVKECDDALDLDFTLPAGSYATILVREIRKRDALAPNPG
ncbi:MAG: tRNA pseudouridine(13) synthase TruD [Myxococcota bacterium]